MSRPQTLGHHLLPLQLRGWGPRLRVLAQYPSNLASWFFLSPGKRESNGNTTGFGWAKFVKKSWRVCCAKSIFAMWHHVHLEHEIVWARIPAQIPSRKNKTCVQICFSCMDLPASQAASKLFINGSTRTVRITWCKKPLEGMQRISMVNS